MKELVHIVLAAGVTVQDVERALVHTGLTLCSSAIAPNVYIIDHTKHRLPPGAYDYALPALLRRQI